MLKQEWGLNRLELIFISVKKDYQLIADSPFKVLF